MRIRITRAPWSTRLGFWRGSAELRELGDFVIWFFGWEIAIWVKRVPATVKREPERADEFVCVWFELAQKWVVLFPDGTVLDEGYRAIGYAQNAALEHLKAAEADFDVCEDTGSFYSFVRASEEAE